MEHPSNGAVPYTNTGTGRPAQFSNREFLCALQVREQAEAYEKLIVSLWIDKLFTLSLITKTNSGDR